MGEVRSLCVVLVWWLVWCGEAWCGSPSVTYIESRWGDFFMAENRSVVRTAAFLVLPTTNLCTCKTQCMASGKCQAWSLVETSPGVSECWLASQGPVVYGTTLDTTTVTTTTPNTNATYFFRKALSCLFIACLYRLFKVILQSSQLT
nr:uncharacterized protein LOC123757064 [Procambarus clarkii]